MASTLVSRAAAYLAPYQLGVGVKGSCKAIIHTVRQVLDEEPTLSLLQTDLVNAFKMANRNASFKEVEKVFPECLSWVLTSYDQPSHLQFGSASISSDVGFQQGDSLAALLFSLLLHPVVQNAEREVPDLRVNAWFLPGSAAPAGC